MCVCICECCSTGFSFALLIKIFSFTYVCFDMHKIVLNSFSSSLHAFCVFVCECVSVELCLCLCVFCYDSLAFVKPKSPPVGLASGGSSYPRKQICVL